MPELTKKDYLADMYNQEVIIENLDNTKTLVIKEVGDTKNAIVDKLENDIKSNLDILVEKVTPVDPTPSGGLFYLDIHTDGTYNGATFTATNTATPGDAYSTAIVEGSGRITIEKAGTYKITNTKDDQTQQVTFEDTNSVTFTSFKATINVTIPTDLVGYTIQCKQGGDVFEQVAASTTVTFTVNKAGQWTIGVKDNPLITTSVSVSAQTTYPATLTVDKSTVPTLIVTSKAEDNGKTLKLTKGSVTLTQKLVNRKCTFILPETGDWTLSCDDYPLDNKVVNIKETKEYKTFFRTYILGYEVAPNNSNPSTRVTYTDDAVGKNPAKMNMGSSFDYGDFADEWFVVDNHVWAIDASGNRYKQCKDNDYSQFTDGSSSGYNSTSTQYNFMASFPTCWIHRETRSDGTRVVKISPDKVDDTYHAYGWENQNGEVQDYMYLSAFEGSDVSSKLRSLGGQPVMVSKDADTERSYAEKNGTGWTTLDFCKWQAYIDLLVLISKSTNTQGSFGYGYANGNSAAIQTGTLFNKGQFWGESTGKQAVKAFHVENPWGNVRMRCAGFVIKTDGRCYVKTHKPYNSDGSGYTMISDVPAISTNLSGYISAGKSTEYGFVATATSNGSETTYECDGGWYYKPSSGVSYPDVGGRWNNAGNAGAFCFVCSYAPSSTHTYIGASLSYV